MMPKLQIHTSCRERVRYHTHRWKDYSQLNTVL